MDTGEQFFSEYLAWLKDEKPPQGPDDLCLCPACAGMTNIEEEKEERTERFRVDGPSNVTPEQHQQTQQQANTPNQNQIMHVSNPTPTLVPAYSYQSPGPWFTVPSAPVMWINPYMVPLPNWNHCFGKYKQCCSRLDRRGRPPHDNRCPFKPSYNNKTN